MLITDVPDGRRERRFLEAAGSRHREEHVMMNHYIWTQLYGQREAQLRATSRHRGGDAAPTSNWSRWAARLPGPGLGRPVASARGTLGAGPPVAAPARRRTVAHPPTPAAAAWARLAAGNGSLARGAPGDTEDERDAA